MSTEMHKSYAMSSRKQPVRKAGAHAAGRDESKGSGSHVSVGAEEKVPFPLSKGNAREEGAEETQLSWSLKVSRSLVESLLYTWN